MSSSATPENSPLWHEARAIVRGAHGLHARPAIRFSRTAKEYAARIQVCTEEDQRWVDAKSLSKVMSLQVEAGRGILLRASGDDAEAALLGLCRLVETDLAAHDEDEG